MGKREAPPGPGSPLPRPASPKPFAGVGPGASGFCVLHTWRKSQRKPVWNWALCSQGLAGCHGRPIWIVGNRVGLPPAQACFRGSLNISGFYLVVNLSLGKTLPAEGDPMFCPQRRVQPLQLRGGFSLNPMSALSESAVSGTPGRARVCQTLLGAGPWETPNLTPQKANKTVEICNFLCVFVRSWHPPGSSSTWGHQLAEGASNHQCFCPWCLVCDLVLGAWPLQ